MKVFKNVLIGFLIMILSFGSAVGGTLFSLFFFKDSFKDTAINTNNITEQRVVQESSAVVNVAEKSSKSVVSVVVSANSRKLSSGTGFIVRKDGLIITNRHVVNSNNNVTYKVITNDGDSYDATLVAKDTLLDIAFLKITSDKEFEALNLGSSANLKVGQGVIAIGNALGEYNNSVTYGIVSGLSRNIVAGDELGGSLESLDNVIQTDAGINPGNSGGPLLDLDGNVVGVNVAIAADAENIGFAIPIDIVKDLLERLDQTGSIKRPALGVRYRNVDEYTKEQYDLNVDYGALIVSENKTESAIIAGSPAAKAGLKAGDVILEVNGKKIDSEQNTLFKLIQSHRIGDKITIKVNRDSKDLTFQITLEDFALQ